MENLASLSLVAVYSAMGVYTLAFIAFTLDLAKRSAAAPAPTAAATVPAGVTVGSSGTTVLDRDELLPENKDGSRGGATVYQRVAFALAILGFLLHMGATITRGVAADRVPWANMFEFGLTATAVGMGTFLVVQLWKDVRYLGAYITGLTLLSLGIVTVNFYVDVVPLPPALQSAWLVIHVVVAVLATAFFSMGAALSVMQLMRHQREVRKTAGLRFLDTVPAASALESLAYRINVVGFVFWTFTLVAGAIWAERAWGRYWGWDTKEVWTFIIWVLFAGYIHARATRGWRGNRSAWLAIIGFSAVIFNYTIVNLYFDGLHSYSGL
jgi:cytochrome c-type biogenesis protein CcsB